MTTVIYNFTIKFHILIERMYKDLLHIWLHTLKCAALSSKSKITALVKLQITKVKLQLK